MPICVGVVCEKCERFFLLAHPDTAKWIRATGQPDPYPPYELKCLCKAVRGFDNTKMLPCWVLDVTNSRGYAERNQYEVMPSRVK